MVFDWYTSDQHFGHKKIIELCNRPFSCVEEMDRELIERYRSCVRDTDRVAFVGDFSFSKPSRTVEIMKQLPGQKFLIRGNHDKGTTTHYLNAGFLLVIDEIVARLDGVETIISHYPPKDPNQSRVHGHTHFAGKLTNKAVHVGVDAWNYYPASGVEVQRLLSMSSAKDIL